MSLSSIRWIVFLTGIGFAGMALSAALQLFTFDGDARKLSGWKADATGGHSGEWRIERGAPAPNASHVLTLVRNPKVTRGTFNLYWTPAVRFRDGSLETRIRANSGRIDQGGGLIWRARDANNYYIARYNPLERNLRFYYVKDGVRIMLADAPELDVGANEWFTLKVIQRGARIEVLVNGKKQIDTTDTTFPDSGGVGFWTKADAYSSFDHLRVTHEH